MGASNRVGTGLSYRPASGNFAKTYLPSETSAKCLCFMDIIFWPQHFPEPVFVNVYVAQELIWRNRFRQPMYYVACRAGTTNRVVVPACQAENLFLGSLKGLQIRALLPQLSRTAVSSWTKP
jgi:hypothetical protein